MNEVTKTILKHKYKDNNMKKQIFIYTRSKNKRIQNKAFTKLFCAFMKENPVSIIGKVVLMNENYYVELKRIVELNRGDMPCEDEDKDKISLGKSYDFLLEGKNNEYDEEYKDYINEE